MMSKEPVRPHGVPNQGGPELQELVPQYMSGMKVKGRSR